MKPARKSWSGASYPLECTKCGGLSRAAAAPPGTEAAATPVTPHATIGFSGIRVLDGGLATELERRGCDISGPLWSAHVLDDSPQTLANVHLDYLRAAPTASRPRVTRFHPSVITNWAATAAQPHRRCASLSPSPHRRAP